MSKKNSTKPLLFVSIVLFCLFLPASSFGQVTVSSGDSLLKEYIFPISSYQKIGAPVNENGADCVWYQGYASTIVPNCSDMPVWGTARPAGTDPIYKWTDNNSLITTLISKFQYSVTVENQDNYVFKLSASNDSDNFFNLSREQIDYVFQEITANGYDEFDDMSYQVSPQGDLSILEYSADNGELAADSNLKYDLFRSMIFSVSVGTTDAAGNETIEKKGYLIIRNDGTKVNEGEVVLGNLTAGAHNIYVNFLTDYYYNFTSQVQSLPAYLKIFANADLNQDLALDVNPIISQVAIDKIRPADDAIGIRIYSNQENIDPATWYRENVVNASGGIEQIKVDGYQAVRDDRTVYVNAANLDEKQVCIGGSDDGKDCTVAGDCASGNCGVRRFFYTNIYVIAFNQNATPSTRNIYTQMFDNWVFNRNVIADDPINAEVNKDKLRRDTIRKADLANMNRLFKSYYQSTGKYPALDAGTFIKSHSISVWPSWQATLGNELKAALPVDPLNLMSAETRGPFDCTNPLESANCVVKCASQTLGCPANYQCVDNSYCSICPIGYDAKTCWDEVNSLFAYYDNIHGKNCNPQTKVGCCDPSLQGSFNLGGTVCTNNGAFVYQYATVEAGKNYTLSARFEYSDTKTCSPDQCAFGNKCYPAGACLAGCDATGQNCGYCSDPSKLTKAGCVAPSIWTSLDQYKSQYCYLGNWRPSCGDGFVQNSCGETCDYNALKGTTTNSWCDVTYGAHDWYNEANISESCSQTCQAQIAGVNYAPPRYSSDLKQISCGGYCGDYLTQNIYGEQCDQGSLPAPLKPREQKGTAGISQVSQYMCSGQSGGAPIVANGSACQNYSHWTGQTPATGTCGTLRLNQHEDFLSIFSSKNNTTYDSVQGLVGFMLSYTFNPTKEGVYNFKIKTANGGNDYDKPGDNLSALTNDQIAYLIAQKVNGDVNVHFPVDAAGNILYDVPSNDPSKYDLIRSLIYAVYLDPPLDVSVTQPPGNKVGYIVVPANGTPQEASISLGNLGTGTHVVYLEFIGDHLYWPIPGNLPEYLNNFSNVDSDNSGKLDVNPIVYSVALYSPELGVGNCKSFGGYCGDGTVQLEYGEQCDVKNFDIPTPAETANLAKNPSFEGFLTPWKVEGAQAEVDEINSFDRNSSLKLSFGTNVTEANIWQSAYGFAGQTYNFVVRAKAVSGQISKVRIQGGSQSLSGGWGTVADLVADVTKISNGWQYFSANVTLGQTDNVYKFRIIFQSTGQGAIINVDDVKIRTFGLRPQYDCASDTSNGKLCQVKGGYCGDGVIQKPAGESCDDKVGYTCTSNAACGANGICSSGICTSSKCTENCQGSTCGDGLVQTPNSDGVNEVCDWATDAYCANDCSHIKMGGECSASKPCDTNLSCSIRNFGDITPKCLGARGSYGCRYNNDCILGYYCDIATTKCQPEITTYLKYHPEPIPVPSPQLPIPGPPAAPVYYDIHNTICPYLVKTSSEQGFELLLDRCTSIHWEAADNITQNSWSYQDAVTNACVGNNRLPTIMELYSLVRQTNSGLFYSDKEALRLCPLNCQYAPNTSGLCSNCPDDNYVYWSSTCVQKNAQDKCTKALAVNFKYGSIEEYPTVDDIQSTPNYDDAAKFKTHCLRDVTCGNSQIEQGETCEFAKGKVCQSSSKDGQPCTVDTDCPTADPAVNGNCQTQFIEMPINNKCGAYGYDGGFLHCNPETCNFRFENCYLNSAVNQTCQEICQARKQLNCQSIGLDIAASDEVFDLSAQNYKIAQNGAMLDIDGASDCDIVTGQGCTWVFQNKNVKCIDTVSKKQAPFVSQFSYCNCAE